VCVCVCVRVQLGHILLLITNSLMTVCIRYYIYE